MQIKPLDDSACCPYTPPVREGKNQGLAAEEKVDTKIRPDSPSQQNVPTAPQDEYIPSGDDAETPSGVYTPEPSEKARSAASSADPTSPEARKESATGSGEDEKSVEEEKATTSESDKKDKGTLCTTNTDRVDSEIKKLKEKRTQLEKRLQGTPADENQLEDLKKELSQLEAELSAKDNDAYRKQNATYTFS